MLTPAELAAHLRASERSMILDAEELRALTGYTQQSKQLATLHRMGFWRARIDRLGRVILECAHYDAVCAGADREQKAPRLRDAPSLRAA